MVATISGEIVIQAKAEARWLQKMIHEATEEKIKFILLFFSLAGM